MDEAVFLTSVPTIIYRRKLSVLYRVAVLRIVSGVQADLLRIGTSKWSYKHYLLTNKTRMLWTCYSKCYVVLLYIFKSSYLNHVPLPPGGYTQAWIDGRRYTIVHRAHILGKYFLVSDGDGIVWLWLRMRRSNDWAWDSHWYSSFMIFAAYLCAGLAFISWMDVINAIHYEWCSILLMKYIWN